MFKQWTAFIACAFCLVSNAAFAQPVPEDARQPSFFSPLLLHRWVPADDLSITSFTIDACYGDIPCLQLNDALQGLRIVTLQSQVTGEPLEYRAWEGDSLTNVRWLPYDQSARFELSEGLGLKHVNFQVRKRFLEEILTNPKFTTLRPAEFDELMGLPSDTIDTSHFLGSIADEAPGYIYTDIVNASFQVTRRISIASIGDSLASGEGAPNFVGTKPSIWTDPQCHRSDLNARALAVAALEANYVDGVDLLSIDFLDLGCTGASINVGLLGPFAGTTVDTNEDGVPEVLDAKPAQIDELAAWLQNRPRLDVLIISIGVNDIGFAKIIASCISPISLGCQRDEHIAEIIQNGDIENTTARPGLNNLLAAYNELALAIEEINPRHVLITEYPDPSHRNDNEFCGCRYEAASFPGARQIIPRVGCMTDEFKVGPEHFIPPWGEIQPKFWIGGSAVYLAEAENRWMISDVLIPLNQRIRTAALINGWTYVGGMMEATRDNGICVANRFFNNLRDSFVKQGDLHGSMHPVWLGHQALRDALLPVLESRLGLAP